jgi:hypothetical protein
MVRSISIIYYSTTHNIHTFYESLLSGHENCVFLHHVHDDGFCTSINFEVASRIFEFWLFCVFFLLIVYLLDMPVWLIHILQ